jgi:hypothetical protein
LCSSLQRCLLFSLLARLLHWLKFGTDLIVSRKMKRLELEQPIGDHTVPPTGSCSAILKQLLAHLLITSALNCPFAYLLQIMAVALSLGNRRI